MVLTWQPTEGAKGYAVYKKTGSGRWKRAGETVEATWTDGAPARESTITYRVVPMGFGENGEITYGKFAYKGIGVKT